MYEIYGQYHSQECVTFQIETKHLNFQKYEHQDLESLEREHAYPPRFQLSFCNYNSFKHLCINIEVQLENGKHSRENSICNFFINTAEYPELMQDMSISQPNDLGTTLCSLLLCVELCA